MAQFNELKVWANDDGTIVQRTNDLIVGGSNGLNRHILITPWDIENEDVSIQVVYTLPNGKVAPVKFLERDEQQPTVEFQGQTWNQYFYEMEQDTLAKYPT